MDEKRSVEEEIEESLRICEEILNNNPDIISKKSDIELDEILRETNREPSDSNPVQQEMGKTAGEVKHTSGASVKEEPIYWGEQPGVQSIPPREIQHTVENSGNRKTDKKAEEKIAPVPKKNVKTKTRKRGVGRTLISLLVCIVIAVASAFLITHFVANHTTVEGGSMEPCLKNNDELIVEKISYLTGKPERFDVVVFKFNENTNYIKRIIGLPGENVRIEEGKIYINDQAIFDEFANGVMEDAGIAEKTVSLGADEYFVLGDNRNASKDSRHKDVGVVKGDKIIGKAWLRMMPFGDFGFIK